MRYLSYIICSIIVFIYWISNADARKFQDQNLIKTAFVQGMKRLKRAIYSVDRYMSDALPGLQEETEQIVTEPEYEPTPRRLKKSSAVRGRRSSLLPLVVQRRNPLGKKAPAQKALQKLNAVATAPSVGAFTLPVKRPTAVVNKKPLATGPPKKNTR